MLVASGAHQPGPPEGAPAGWSFTGRVWSYLNLPPADGIIVNSVCFEPGARTFWHTHEVGQLLQVVAGRGLVQAEGEVAVTLHAGDTVWAPAGERHWHGADSSSYLVHVAISIGGAEWHDEVAAAVYEEAGG